MGFLREHELAGARQRLETGFGKRRKLILAVAISKHREAEKIEPIIAGLVEGLEDSRLVGIPAAALEQRVGFIATVPSKVALQQVDHRPQVATLFDVYLKQVSQIVERRASLAKLTLLLDRGWFGVALGHDNAAQRVAKFTRHFLVSRLSVVVTETDLCISLGGFKKNAPAIVRHLHEIKVGPTVRLDADGGAEINVFLLESIRTHLLPPVKIIWQPLFQCSLQLSVFGQVHVIRNAFVKIHNVLPIESELEPQRYKEGIKLRRLEVRKVGLPPPIECHSTGAGASP